MGNTNTKSDILMDAEKAEIEQSYNDAESLYLQAMQYLEPDTEEMATCHDRLGCLLVRSGRLDSALLHFKKALAIKKNINPASSSVAKTLSNVASVYSGRGEHEKALTILDECLGIREKKNPDSIKLAKTLGNIAVILSHLERYHDAIRFHEKAFDIKKLKAPGSVSMATTCVNLANLCMRTDPSKSVFYLKRAKLIAETSRPVPYAVLADVFTVTGHILRHADLFEDAVDMYEKAIAFEEYVNPRSPKIVNLKSEIDSTHLQDAETTEQVKMELAENLKDSEESSQLNESINETAQELLAMSHPEIPLQTHNHPSAAVPINPAPSFNLEMSHSFASLAPPGYGNTGFGMGGEAIPFPPSFDGPVDEDCFMPHIPHAQSLPALPESEFYEPKPTDYQSAQSLPVLPEDDDDRQPPVSNKRDESSPPSLAEQAAVMAEPSDGDTLDFLVSLADGRQPEEVEKESKVSTDSAIRNSYSMGAVELEDRYPSMHPPPYPGHVVYPQNTRRGMPQSLIGRDDLYHSGELNDIYGYGLYREHPTMTSSLHDRSIREAPPTTVPVSRSFTMGTSRDGRTERMKITLSPKTRRKSLSSEKKTSSSSSRKVKPLKPKSHKRSSQRHTSRLEG